MLFETMMRPDLKQPVTNLIGRISTGHATGNFAIPLESIFASFGLDAAPFASRGDVQFTSTGANQGEFVNVGEPVAAPFANGLTLQIPRSLNGSYLTTPSSLTLKFASPPRACKRVIVMICQDINRIDADEHKLYIDLPGDNHDLCFTY